MRALHNSVTIAMLMTCAACAGSPTQIGTSPSGTPQPSPSPTPAPPTVSVTYLGLFCGQVLDGYQCSARLEKNGESRDVTGFTTWSTSDTAIATVNSVGFVTVLRDGQVAIRASYEGESNFLNMTVEAGGTRRYFRALSGWVLDAETEKKLGGVSVAFVAGENAGRTGETGPEGAYQIYDLQPGSFTIRFSKAGYSSADYFFTLPGDRIVSLDARLRRLP